MGSPAHVPERRICRLAIEPCQHCGHDPQVVSRTSFVVYVRCADCGEAWSVPKPGAPKLSGLL